MLPRGWLFALVLGVSSSLALLIPPMLACCPAGPEGQPVINADQTVIIIWDKLAQTQHFIRQASFKSEADDFGFLIPSPSEPELAESADEAFDYLKRLTAPETRRVSKPGGTGCACGGGKTKSESKADAPSVRVLQEKQVAGFQAVVLEADNSAVLVNWLREHGYAFSPAIEAWATPYIADGWKITALKVAVTDDTNVHGHAKTNGWNVHAHATTVSAKALRMTFRTDRPLFPYREPDYGSAAQALDAKNRLLRIYFLAEARYGGKFEGNASWTGKVAWANKLDADSRKAVLEELNLPEGTGPAEMWLTEFEDYWPYKVAPADVYFAEASNQNALARPPVVVQVDSIVPRDITLIAVFGIVATPPLLIRIRRWQIARRGTGA